METAACWSDLTGTQRHDKPWLNGLPRLIFVSDMSDALSSVVPFEFLEQEIIANVMSKKGQRHCWLWLTKRPDRMVKFSAFLQKKGIAWPINLWAGTSVTTQGTTRRITDLLKVGNDQTIRFLSIEPQWERIDITHWLPRLDWVIQGGESGPGANPFHSEWVIDLLRQCKRRRVPYFLKQLGTIVHRKGEQIRFDDNHGGDWSEWPREIQVRQMPRVRRRKTVLPKAAPKNHTEARLSNRAKKAWITRKRNEKKWSADAWKRSEAARKAWDTRRKDALARKCSEAARKACALDGHKHPRHNTLPGQFFSRPLGKVN